MSENFPEKHMMTWNHWFIFLRHAHHPDVTEISLITEVPSDVFTELSESFDSKAQKK